MSGLVALVLTGVLAFAAALLSPEAFASSATSGDKQFHYVVAQSGDSLWSLVSELDPQADPRDLIAEIVQLNQLDGSGLEAGQAIAVPLRYSDKENPVSS
jgi:LysM repeat protein